MVYSKEELRQQIAFEKKVLTQKKGFDCTLKIEYEKEEKIFCLSDSEDSSLHLIMLCTSNNKDVFTLIHSDVTNLGEK